MDAEATMIMILTLETIAVVLVCQDYYIFRSLVLRQNRNPHYFSMGMFGPFYGWRGEKVKFKLEVFTSSNSDVIVMSEQPPCAPCVTVVINGTLSKRNYGYCVQVLITRSLYVINISHYKSYK